MPGVEHARIVRTRAALPGASGGAASRGAINALRIDLAQVRLDVVHALDAAIGLEGVSSMAQRHGAIAAINGGYLHHWHVPVGFLPVRCISMARS